MMVLVVVMVGVMATIVGEIIMASGNEADCHMEVAVVEA